MCNKVSKKGRKEGKVGMGETAEQQIHHIISFGICVNFSGGNY